MVLLNYNAILFDEIWKFSLERIMCRYREYKSESQEHPVKMIPVKDCIYFYNSRRAHHSSLHSTTYRLAIACATYIFSSLSEAMNFLRCLLRSIMPRFGIIILEFANVCACWPLYAYRIIYTLWLSDFLTTYSWGSLKVSSERNTFSSPSECWIKN